MALLSSSSFTSFSELFHPPGSERVCLEPPLIRSCLLSICNALENNEHKFKLFSKIRWENVENRCSPMMRTLPEVLFHALQVQLTNEDYSEIMATYTNKRARFLHKIFLRDIIDSIMQISRYVEANYKPEEIDKNEQTRKAKTADYKHDRVSIELSNKRNSSVFSISEPVQAPVTLPPVKVERIVARFGTYNKISCHGGVVKVSPPTKKWTKKRKEKESRIRRCSMSAIDRDAVVEKLTTAMDTHYPLRLHLNIQSFRMISDMTEEDFAREMKRVLDLNLDKQEAHTLFELFDFEGCGVIKESQLHEGLAKLHIAKMRDNKKAKVRQKREEISPDLDMQSSPNRDNVSPPNKDRLRAGSIASANTSFVKSNYSFLPDDFHRAIEKISRRYERHARHCPKLNPPLLRVQDGYLNRKFVRRALWEQLEIKLTAQEIDALCYKLSYGTTDERVAMTEDDAENPRLMIIGKSLKALIVRIANFVVKKIPSLIRTEASFTDETLNSRSLLLEEPNTNNADYSETTSLLFH